MPTTRDRGYGAEHQAERARWKPRVDRGEVGCQERPCILPGQPLNPTDWHLAHDDDHPGQYLGPAHPLCNDSKAGKKARGTLTSTVPDVDWGPSRWWTV